MEYLLLPVLSCQYSWCVCVFCVCVCVCVCVYVRERERERERNFFLQPREDFQSAILLISVCLRVPFAHFVSRSLLGQE